MPILEIICFLLGAVLGAAVVYVVMARRQGALSVQLGKVQTEMDLTRQQFAQQQADNQKHYEQQQAESQRRYEQQLTENQRRYEQQLAMLRQQFEQQTANSRQQAEEQLLTATERLKNLSQQLLSQQAQQLKNENKESIQNATLPLKEAITDMRRAISESSKTSTEQSASLREQLRLMMESNREIGEKAEGLANVLRRDNKVSGTMGEIILGDLLASQGLTEGIHYEVQARLRDETGRPVRHDETGQEMQPDVILHYPQGQDVVVDSKVSLVAYQRYMNAQTPEEKEKALQEHIRSVRAHVSELARKDYSRYVKPPREAVDFVLMFVPFETSLQLALANDPTLWRDAFERKVFVTGEQNLLAILHMIHLAWVQNQQAESQKKVFGVAEQLLDRLGDFIQRYRDVGERLAAVQKAYEFAGNKLVDGRQSVVQKGRELVDLGAKENPTRRIPSVDALAD